VQQPGASPSLSGISTASAQLDLFGCPAGNYLIALSIAGATSATAFGATSLIDCTAVNLMSKSAVRDAASFTQSLAGTTTAASMITLVINKASLDIGSQIQFSFPTVVGTGTGDLWIVSLPSTVLTLAEQEEEEIRELQEENKLLNDRLSRIEQMLAASSSVPSWLGSRLSAEEKEDEDSEGNVYVPARPRKLPARAELPSLEALRR